MLKWPVYIGFFLIKKLVKIQTNKNKDIADQGNFKRRGYRIYEKEAKLENEELKYTYKYGAKGTQKTQITYNEEIIGTKKEEYAQIQDAPPKEEKGNAWVNFAIGALATVGLVVETIATGGLAALALVGAALGVATATVSMIGKEKPLGEAVKEIAIGAATGGIGGCIDVKNV